jgi:hypothetical protein
MNKKFKKLSLSLETVRQLTAPDLKEAAGGIAPTDFTARCTECTRACTICIP